MLAFALMAAAPVLASLATPYQPIQSAVPTPSPESLADQALTLIQARQRAQVLPILDQAIAAEEKAYADEKRQIFCAGSPQETQLYVSRGATMKKEVVVIGPTWALVLFLKGFVLIDVGRADEAGAYLERAVSLSPLDAQYLGEFAEWHKSRKDWAKAYEVFQRASDAADLTSTGTVRVIEKTRAMRGMGFARIEQGRLDEAEKLFRDCLEMNPDDIIARNELAYIGEQRAKARLAI